jgi:hypothetical protein
MTRTVREKAIRLLATAVSDYSGNEKKIADALLEELKVSNLVFDHGSSSLIEKQSISGSPVDFGWIVPKLTDQILH